MQSESPSLTRRELLHAKLDALLDESDLVADHAAYGETFDDMENFFLVQGRKFLKETFQEQLQKRIDHTETTDTAKQCPHCKKNALPRRSIGSGTIEGACKNRVLVSFSGIDDPSTTLRCAAKTFGSPISGSRIINRQFLVRHNVPNRLHPNFGCRLVCRSFIVLFLGGLPDIDKREEIEYVLREQKRAGGGAQSPDKSSPPTHKGTKNA